MNGITNAKEHLSAFYRFQCIDCLPVGLPCNKIKARHDPRNYVESEWVHCGSPCCTVCQILIVMPMVSAITRISSVREIVPLEGAFQQEVIPPQPPSPPNSSQNSSPSLPLQLAVRPDPAAIH